MASKGTKGRKGAKNDARVIELIISEFIEKGDRVDAKDIARVFDQPVDHANKLLSNALTSSNSDTYNMPLIFDSEDESSLTLIDSRGARGYKLRLGPGEAIALIAALERLGIPEEDQLRARLVSSLLASDAPSGDMVRRTLGGENSVHAPENVRTCAAARANNVALRFMYTKVGQQSTEERRVFPEALTCEEDLWYLDAYDFARSGRRRFRVDRMERLVLEDIPQTAPQDLPVGEKNREQTMVQLTYTDIAYLEKYLWWPRLEFLTQNEDGSGTAQIPYLENSTWLPRQVAACGGTVTTNNPQVNQLAREYAEAQLNS